MGLEHGLYCLGCCWLLFVLLFPIGVMNLAAMLLITALIFAEKALPAGERTARFAAAALIGYGALVLAVPAALPLPAWGTATLRVSRIHLPAWPACVWAAFTDGGPA
jgi:Na+-transporting NADH:ubiquinone oxidoreductase subunit NqrB